DEGTHFVRSARQFVRARSCRTSADSSPPAAPILQTVPAGRKPGLGALRNRSESSGFDAQRSEHVAHVLSPTFKRIVTSDVVPAGSRHPRPKRLVRIQG